jgi:hypothetical protein
LVPRDAAFAVPDSVIDPPDAPPVSTIVVTPNPIVISGPAGVETSATFTVSGTGGTTHLQSFTWFMAEPDYRTENPACPSSMIMCPYGTSFPVNPPIMGQVFCTPTSGFAREAQLQASSNITPIIHTVMVRCEVPPGGPSFQAPDDVGPLMAQVNGTPALGSMTITNNGSEMLDILVELGTVNATHWAVTNCFSSACTVAPNGGSVLVPIQFDPLVHGTLNNNATITATSHPLLQPKAVTLLGTGLGSVLRVDDPPDAPQTPFTHDFGTIAKNQEVTFPIKITNAGNFGMNVDASLPTAPFEVTTTPLPITIGAAFRRHRRRVNRRRRCPCRPRRSTSRTPATGEHERRHREGTIADTTVIVTNPLNFGEPRRRAGGVINISITNPNAPASPPIDLEAVRLVGAPNAVTLAPVTPGPLAGGQTVMTTLTLATEEVVDATAFDATRFQVDVDEGGTVTLEQTVTGKVGEPSAIVLPKDLDLGTVVSARRSPASQDDTNGSSTLRCSRR